MTANTTEQERAKFEVWARDRYPSIDLTRGGDDYSKALAKDYWSLWQSARSVPAVPVPQGWKLVPKEATPEMLEQVWYLGYDEMRDAYCVLVAAAPQPPEADHIPDAGKMVAAPVQLPKPVAIITDTVPREPGWKTMFVPDSGTRLYTEHQVIAILAQHGIKTK